MKGFLFILGICCSEPQHLPLTERSLVVLICELCEKVLVHDPQEGRKESPFDSYKALKDPSEP